MAEDFDSAGGGAQRSSASHSTDPSVRSPGLTNVTRSILAAPRGERFREIHTGGPWFCLLGSSHYWQADVGQTPHAVIQAG